MNGSVFIALFVLILGFLITALFVRWLFRIDDIIKRLDDIKPLVEAMGYVVERLNTIVRLLEGKKEKVGEL